LLRIYKDAFGCELVDGKRDLSLKIEALQQKPKAIDALSNAGEEGLVIIK